MSKAKIALIIAGVIVLLVGIIFIASGFRVCDDVMLVDFTCSGDEISIDTAIASSVGYTRACVAKAEGNRLLLRFYSAFGGLNSSIGAKSSFLLKPAPDCTDVYVVNSKGVPSAILHRDASDLWQRVER